MIIQNALTTNIQVDDIKSSVYAAAPLVLIPATPTTIYNSDAEKSKILNALIAAASVTVIDSTTEPSTGVSTVKLTGTTNGTTGTRSTHAHSLGYTPTKVIIVPSAANDDVANAASVCLVTTGSSTITVKATAASVPFTAYVM